MTPEPELTAPLTRRGKKTEYQVARPSPSSRSLALVDFGDEDENPFALESKPDYSSVLPTQTQVRKELMGSRGLKSISMFSGGGGALTGFAWSGWHDIAAVEFVKAARDSIALNYSAHTIEPDDVLNAAKHVAKGMKIGEMKSLSDKKEHFNLSEAGIEGERGLVVNGQSRINGKIITASVNWEETRLRLGEEDFRTLRSRVNDKLLPMAEYARENDRMLIWGDDIRGLEGKLILAGYGLKWGELDGAHGGPPCKGFSHSGIRERGWGLTHRYSDERFQQVDELFFEFIRVLGEVGAKTFLAENVVGIGDADARDSHFNPIIEAFEVAGYRVEARPMTASNYGVPQTRPRMIFQGVRSDLVDKHSGEPLNPVWPKKELHVYTVGDALAATSHLNTPEELEHADLGTYESGRTWDRLKPGEAPKNKQFNMMRLHPDMPAPTITATGASEASSAGACHPFERRKFTTTELLGLTSFPMGYQLAGNFRQQGERIGRTACPLMVKKIGDVVAEMLDRAVSTKEEAPKNE